LAANPASNFDLIYALQESTFPGSVRSWVGQYKAPVRASFDVSGIRDSKPISIRAAASLPGQESRHADLPRLWAKARVDALLGKIERDGEDQVSIDEIIRLSRKYKFVT